MKKRIASVALVAVMAVCLLCGCGSEVEDKSTSDKSMFVCVETATSRKVVYHRETKVMYAVSYRGYNHGTFTLLVNADGTPMLYETAD